MAEQITNHTSTMTETITEKSPAATTDEALMKEFQGGSEAAFVALMKRHKEPIINFLYRFVGNYDDAVDLAQETFVRLFKYGQTYLPDVKFSTWLYTIASNLARTELKKSWRRNSVSFSSMGDDDSEEFGTMIPDGDYLPDERVDHTMIAQRVQRALMSVSPSYREVVVLRDIQQLSYEEIAEVTKSEIGTVKSRINRGRKQLQEQLQGLYKDMFSGE
ncbi:MAG: sigma-70 family RNA polymerase sigma factor [Bacteroidota bacterium]